MDRAQAQALDASDPLSAYRAEFVIDDDGPIYMDGNSLGRLSRGTAEALRQAVEEWGSRLVTGWQEWVDLPTSTGDLVGRLIGAEAGQVLVADSTTVNLFKLAVAALNLHAEKGHAERRHAGQPQSGQPVVVCDENEFPTDRYVLAGLPGVEVRQLRSDPIIGVDVDELASVVDERTALVCLSHVNYRSGARLDIEEVTSLVHDRGALMLWDLCHSAGGVPVGLDSARVDLAVGCTYKYLNAGPGSPAFLYVSRDLQGRLRSPIQGWFAQHDQFAMGETFQPVKGVGGFAAGTPPVLGLIAVAASASQLLEAGVELLWSKSQKLTAMIVDLVAERLAQYGIVLGSPTDPGRRGAHVSVRHADGWPLCKALISRGLVIPDFRAPDTVRLGPAPIYTRFVDVYDAVERIANVLEGGGLPRDAGPRPTVT